MKLPVLARGDAWLVVAKPPGLLTHRGEGVRADHYALQVVRDQVGRHVHPVHRLDRPASGCLLFALDPTWARILQAAMAAPDARKTYLAFVRGRWRRPPGLPRGQVRGRSRQSSVRAGCRNRRHARPDPSRWPTSPFP